MAAHLQRGIARHGIEVRTRDGDRTSYRCDQRADLHDRRRYAGIVDDKRCRTRRCLTADRDADRPRRGATGNRCHQLRGRGGEDGRHRSIEAHRVIGGIAIETLSLDGDLCPCFAVCGHEGKDGQLPG